jgi:hypothetical protein
VDKFEVQDYLLSLPFNNVEHVLAHKDQLKLISMDTVHHANILEDEAALVAGIVKK